MKSTETRTALGRRIQSLRKAVGITQSRLAEEVGWARTSIVNVEAGKQGVDADRLARIAAALQVDIGDLFRAVELPAVVPLSNPERDELRRLRRMEHRLWSTLYGVLRDPAPPPEPGT